MRPPNYTLLMIWLPVILFAFIVGYLKRENLHAIYEPRYWAIAAMVYLLTWLYPLLTLSTYIICVVRGMVYTWFVCISLTVFSIIMFSTAQETIPRGSELHRLFLK